MAKIYESSYIFKNQVGNKRAKKKQTQNLLNEYYWEELIRAVTHSDLNKYLHHYFVENLKSQNKIRKSEVQ